MGVLDTAIPAIIKAGFSVYMRNPDDTWLYFTDGTRIGYLQASRMGSAYSLSTVHVPSSQHGTGFAAGELQSDNELTAETLSRAFMHAPHWAHDTGSVRKWRDFEAFKKSSRFNADYNLVEV